MFQTDAHLQLKARYGLSSLRDKINFVAQDLMVRFNIEQVEAAVLTGLRSGILRPDQLRGRIVDFGCGPGVSTAVLASYGADVTGVDLNANSLDEGKKLSFVPAGKVVKANGIDFLKSLPPGSLDAVSASMLGPDMRGDLCCGFLQGCQHALKAGGTILVTSEIGTLTTLKRVNFLGNGFVQDGVFLAFRGADKELLRNHIASANLEYNKYEGKDYKSLLAGIDLSALLKQIESKK